jgi:hypothetical protein
MSIGIPLEYTKKPEPHTMVGVEAPTPLPERSRCAEHEEVVGVFWVGCARPTGDSYGRTTNAPEQRFNGVNLTATLEVG